MSVHGVLWVGHAHVESVGWCDYGVRVCVCVLLVLGRCAGLYVCHCVLGVHVRVLFDCSRACCIAAWLCFCLLAFLCLFRVGV